MNFVSESSYQLFFKAKYTYQGQGREVGQRRQAEVNYQSSLAHPPPMSLISHSAAPPHGSLKLQCLALVFPKPWPAPRGGLCI